MVDIDRYMQKYTILNLYNAKNLIFFNYKKV